MMDKVVSVSNTVKTTIIFSTESILKCIEGNIASLFRFRVLISASILFKDRPSACY